MILNDLALKRELADLANKTAHALALVLSLWLPWAGSDQAESKSGAKDRAPVRVAQRESLARPAGACRRGGQPNGNSFQRRGWFRTVDNLAARAKGKLSHFGKTPAGSFACAHNVAEYGTKRRSTAEIATRFSCTPTTMWQHLFLPKVEFRCVTLGLRRQDSVRGLVTE
jgi:hypothetical protein